jgi:glycerophosphoryl diester phosphodiesterase
VSSPPTGYPYLDEATRRPDGVLAFAHRGGAYHPDIEGLENTMAAFQHAVDLGFGYLETDVHVTRDGVLLAFHDQVLDRVSDRRGAIAELTHAEVAEALIGGQERGPTVPSHRWPSWSPHGTCGTGSWSGASRRAASTPSAP